MDGSRKEVQREKRSELTLERAVSVEWKWQREAWEGCEGRRMAERAGAAEVGDT